MTDLRVYVGSIAWRSLEAPHVKCVHELLRSPNLIYDVKWGDALVDRARAIVATRFLRETDADVLVTIDSDIIFNPRDVWQIAAQAVSHDIVAGLYVTRSNTRCIPASHFWPDQPVDMADDPTPVPLRWAAGGFVATHRRVFERLAADLPLCHASQPYAFYPFYQPFAFDDAESGDTLYLSEDWAFCERARQAGFGVYANPAVRLEHLGVYPYRPEDMTIAQPPTMELVVTRQPGVGSQYHVAYPDPSPVVRLDRAARRRAERDAKRTDGRPAPEPGRRLATARA